jgi:hypothetical protein
MFIVFLIFDMQLVMAEHIERFHVIVVEIKLSILWFVFVLFRILIIGLLGRLPDAVIIGADHADDRVAI